MEHTAPINVHSPPFSTRTLGQLFAVPIGPPLSAAARMRVDSNMPFAFSAATTLPICASMKFAFAAYIERAVTLIEEKFLRKALGTSGGQWQLCQLTKPKKGEEALCCAMWLTMCSANNSSSYTQVGSWVCWLQSRELLSPVAGPPIFHRSVRDPRPAHEVSPSVS